jgi:glucosamine-6-phosphate deaminase
MLWTVFEDHESASQAVALRLLDFVRAKPDATLALPSGNTPTRIYELLKEEACAFAGITVFALDEYVGLGIEDSRSFARFFQDHVFGPFGLPPGQTHVLNGRAEQLAAEAARYEALILARGGLDLTLLGLGGNGHIAFNEPADVLAAHTHVTELAPPASEVASCGITMGMGTLLSAPYVMLIATGAKKAEAVRKMLSGRVDPRCPASLLQTHPRVEVFLDTAAAVELSL